MNYLKQKIIEYLLNNADPAIVLRVKKEILNGLSKIEEKELLSKIITQKNIQIIIKAQKPDGWIGNHFHGQSEMFCFPCARFKTTAFRRSALSLNRDREE